MKPFPLMGNPFLEAALTYIQRGWQVLPLKAAEKCPLGAIVPHGLHQATINPAHINGWWAKEPEANVGIRTGKASGMVVLDIDPRHGGTESLKHIEEKFGSLPATLQSQTGGGGQHIFFSYPGFPIPNKTGLGGWPGIDLKGDNGYIVAPPSIHPSGKAYQWGQGKHPNFNIPFLAPLPTWLSNLITSRSSSKKPIQLWRNVVRQSAPEGTRNMTLTSLIGHLLSHGIDPFVTVELMLAWNQVKNHPPLLEREVLTIVDSIARKELQRRRGKKGEQA